MHRQKQRFKRQGRQMPILVIDNRILGDCVDTEEAVGIGEVLRTSDAKHESAGVTPDVMSAVPSIVPRYTVLLR